jgi:hypothetical protein
MKDNSRFMRKCGRVLRSTFASQIILNHQNKMNTKKFASLLFAAMITISASAIASTSFSVTPSTTSSTYILNYKSNEIGKVKVSIFNSNSEMIFTEVLNNVGSFKRPYNFSELAQGNYTIVIEDKNGKQVENVSYRLNKTAPFINVKAVANAQNKYQVSVSNTGKEQVSVKIYDNANGLLHSDIIEVNGNYGVIYNLQNVKSASENIIIFEVSTSSGKVETAIF